MSLKLPLASLLAATTMGGAQAPATFDGTVSDDMCALNHAAMRMGPTAEECTRACVEEHDAAYVLVDGKHVYRLSDQVTPKTFAGRKVKVVGTLDEASLTITVRSIVGD